MKQGPVVATSETMEEADKEMDRPDGRSTLRNVTTIVTPILRGNISNTPTHAERGKLIVTHA